MRKSRFFAIFACFSRYRKCSNLRVAEKNFEVIVVFLKIYILMVRKPPSFALWDFFLPFSLYFPIFTWLLGMLHDGLNMPYIKFGNPVPNVSEMLNLLSSWTKKMSLDESGRRQNPLKPFRLYRLCSQMVSKATRPGTWQSSCGRLGRSSNAQTARNSKMWRTYRQTYRPTDRPTRQGVESRVRD